jgi:hypothetical protein
MSTASADARVVPCPTCGVNLSIPAALSAPLVACPVCQTRIAVPVAAGQIASGGVAAATRHIDGPATRIGSGSTRKAMRYESMALCGLLVIAGTSIAAYALHLASSPAPVAPPDDVEVVTRAAPAAPKTPTLHRGGEAILSPRARGEVFLALDPSASGEITDAQVLGDKTKLAKLITSGKAASTPSGTRVKIIELEDTRAKVRVLDGDISGTEGWAPSSLLRPVRAADLSAPPSRTRVLGRPPAQPAEKTAEKAVKEFEAPKMPVDPATGFDSGELFDNPSEGMRTNGRRGNFEHPTHARPRPPSSSTFDNPSNANPAPGPGMAPRASASNVPDPSFENPGRGAAAKKKGAQR